MYQSLISSAVTDRVAMYWINLLYERRAPARSTILNVDMIMARAGSLGTDEKDGATVGSRMSIYSCKRVSVGMRYQSSTVSVLSIRLSNLRASDTTDTRKNLRTSILVSGMRAMAIALLSIMRMAPSETSG